MAMVAGMRGGDGSVAWRVECLFGRFAGVSVRRNNVLFTALAATWGWQSAEQQIARRVGLASKMALGRVCGGQQAQYCV